MGFTCCLNMGFDVAILKTSPVAAWADHFIAFRDNVTRGYGVRRRYDVRKFDTGAISFEEICCMKRDFFNVLTAFSVRF